MTMAVEDLWETYAADPTPEIKNQLVMNYLPLVKSIVQRMMPTQMNYNNYDDLINCGVMGLMDAIDRYDCGREAKFETFAYMRVRGEIIDYIRKQDWAPSSMRRQISQVSRAFDELALENGRAATEAEVAERLGLEEKELSNILEKSHTFNMIYFEDMLAENYADHLALRDEESSPSEAIEQVELKQILADMIDSLPQNEKTVVSLYYYEELPFRSIAEVLGVSVSRVSQIHSKVLMKFRSMLKGYISGA